MELSPRARERLASIGELSVEEKERAKYSEELDVLLADYFMGKLKVDGLWMKLRQYLEEGQPYVIKDAQLKILMPVVLGSSTLVFERCRDVILGSEVLKVENNYSEIEVLFKNLETIQKQYRQEMDQAFENMKNKMRAKVETAAQQVARQAGNQQASIDIKASVEASIKTSPEWKEFMQRHDSTYGRRFIDEKDKIAKQIN